MVALQSFDYREKLGGAVNIRCAPVDGLCCIYTCILGLYSYQRQVMQWLRQRSVIMRSWALSEQLHYLYLLPLCGMNVSSISSNEYSPYDDIWINAARNRDSWLSDQFRCLCFYLSIVHLLCSHNFGFMNLIKVKSHGVSSVLKQTNKSWISPHLTLQK